MNQECYVVNNYCTVIGNDGEVRILSKKDMSNQDITFSSLLDSENKLEELQLKREELIDKMEEVKGIKGLQPNLGLSILLALLGFIFVMMGLLIATDSPLPLSKRLLASAVLTIPYATYYNVLHFIDNKKTYKKSKQRVQEIDQEIPKISEEIAKIKEEIIVESYAVKAHMSKEIAKQVEFLIDRDMVSCKMNSEQQARILRNTMNKYLEEEKLPVENGYQYTIGSGRKF